MLRHSAQTFTFHVIPGPAGPHALSEGFGTMALVNRTNDVDRAMLIEIRPPNVVGTAVMREFARDRRDAWWHVPAECCVGDMGQANLLQAQVSERRRFAAEEVRCTMDACRTECTFSP